MSDPHTLTAVRPESFSWDKQGFAKFVLFGLGGILTVIALVIGFGFQNTKLFGFSWLFAFSFYFTLCSGSLFWVLVHHATDAAWSTAIRRVFENVASLFGALAVLFIPVLLCRFEIWHWLSLGPGEDASLDAKAWWFGMWAGISETGHMIVFGRWIFCLFLLAALALTLRNFSLSQDKDGQVKWTIWTRYITYPGIAVFALSFSACVIDWLMALDHTWYSTMWGVYLFAGSAWSSMALCVIIVTLLRSSGHFKGVVSMEHYHVMGKFIFAFSVFWGYIGFSQYMLTWYANIPEETSYFLRRNTESWHFLSTFLVLGHFIAPFFLLLPRAGKKNINFIFGMACWVLLIQMLDLFIIIIPVFDPAGFNFTTFLFCLLCLAAIGSLLAGFLLHFLGRHPLFPARDPRILESIALVN